MAAQLGSSVVLDYGPQGSQQSGSAVVLDFFVAPTTQRIGTSRHTPWGGSSVVRQEILAVMPPSTQSVAERHGPWGVGKLRGSEQHAPWVLASTGDHRQRAPWVKRERFAHHNELSQWLRGLIADDASRAPWGRYERTATETLGNAWVISLASDQHAAAPWGGPLYLVEAANVARFPRSAPVDSGQNVPWSRFARVLAPGVSIQIPPDDGVPDARIVIPVRSVYVQVNSTSLRRVDGNVLLPTFSLNLSLDMASWVWSFNATLPADALSDVEPVDGEPVEIEAGVNGIFFRLLVERISRDRTFGKAAISISGRGKAALLDAPYAPLMAFGNDTGARTLQQLMGDVLTDNGVSLGWDVDFGLTDWLVPTGMFTHTGTYIDAINRLAEAGGGYVQGHRNLNALQILPKYPKAPWEWATLVDPDFELPSAPVTRESIEWVDMPRYNRVYVQGVTGGIVGRVTRAGTAGDLVAQTIVEPLTTHADAARQRGLPVLAQVGRIANVSLRLPVLDDTGIIVPGNFVRYVDGATTRIGIVRATNLDIAMPQVWQTIKLETHLEPV